jgi:hypothetical protein
MEENSNEFSPKSFVIFCLDEESNIAFEASWGETTEEIKRFAIMLHQINSGKLAKLVLDQLKVQSKEIDGGTKKYNQFVKLYSDLDSPSSLVIDPTNVELN